MTEAYGGVVLSFVRRVCVRLACAAAMTVTASLLPSVALAQGGSPVTCPELESLVNTDGDASSALQACLDRAPAGARLELAAGAVYSLAKPVRVSKSVALTTGGLKDDTGDCGLGKSSPCASFFRAPGFRGDAPGREGGALLEVTASGASVDHVVLNGMRELSPRLDRHCSGGTLLRLSGCTDCAVKTVTFTGAPCGSALAISGSRGVSVVDSVFADNGTAIGLASGIAIRESRRVEVKESFFKNNSNFDLNSLSCDECSFVDNVAWHPRPSKTVALGAFRLKSGSARVERNLVDCDSTGCNAAFLFGSTKEGGRPSGGEIFVAGNVVLNAPISFFFGRGPEVSVDDNFALGGELVCREKRFNSFTRSEGAQVRFTGRLLNARHVISGTFSTSVLSQRELRECVQEPGIASRVGVVDSTEPAVRGAVRQLFRRELRRAGTTTEERKVREFLTKRALALGLAVSRVRGLRPIGARATFSDSDGMLPIRCWDESISSGDRREVCAAQDGEDAIVDGDVRIEGAFADESKDRASVQAVSSTNVWLWSGGRVPYEISPGMPADYRPYINQAIAAYNQLSSRTGVVFVPRAGQNEFLQFVYEAAPDSCGFASRNTVTKIYKVALTPALRSRALCTSALAIVLHEIGHALGLDHEHQRSDRDTYLTMLPQNWKPTTVGNLTKRASSGERRLGAYDYSSIMHYGSGQGSKSALPAFVRRGSNQKISGWAETLSASDVTALRSLYPAPTPVPPTRTPLPRMGLQLTSSTSADGQRLLINFRLDSRPLSLHYSVIEIEPSASEATLKNLRFPEPRSYGEEGAQYGPPFVPLSGVLPIAGFTTGCVAVQAYGIWPDYNTSTVQFLKACFPAVPAAAQ